MIACVLPWKTEQCTYWFLAKNPPKGVKIAETISPLAKSSTNVLTVRLRAKQKDVWSARAEVHFSRKLIHSSRPFRVAARLQFGPNTPIIGAYPIPGRPSLHYITVEPSTAGGLEFWQIQAEELSEGFISLIEVKS